MLTLYCVMLRSSLKHFENLAAIAGYPISTLTKLLLVHYYVFIIIIVFFFLARIWSVLLRFTIFSFLQISKLIFRE